MADDASITLTATILPDEIAKTISGSMTISPADANDKWYYKLTSVSNSSTDLIAGYFTDYTAVDDDTAPTAVATGDKVNFLFIKNTDSSNDVYSYNINEEKLRKIWHRQIVMVADKKNSILGGADKTIDNL